MRKKTEIRSTLSQVGCVSETKTMITSDADIVINLPGVSSISEAKAVLRTDREAKVSQATPIHRTPITIWLNETDFNKATKADLKETARSLQNEANKGYKLLLKEQIRAEGRAATIKRLVAENNALLKEKKVNEGYSAQVIDEIRTRLREACKCTLEYQRKFHDEQSKKLYHLNLASEFETELIELKSKGFITRLLWALSRRRALKTHEKIKRGV